MTSDRNGTGKDGRLSAPADAEEKLTARQLEEQLERLCQSKAEEFRLLGYEHVDSREIWECVYDAYRKKGIPPLYQVVNDVLSLKATEFMNWCTLNAFRGKV
jgi:hypothetical protein